ncbi:MAG: OmpA family protein [Kofleriaceae bacterium]
MRWLILLWCAVASAAPLAFHVGYDTQHLDLDGHVLQITMTKPAGSATLVVLGEDGSEIGKGSATFAGEKPGTWLKIPWTQTDGRVLKIKVHVEDQAGGVVNVELVPWSVTIDHEDVNFATDSFAIAETEEPKLTASLDKVNDVIKKSEKFVAMQLYVAGHTDTVGSAAKNKKLSLDRARAIATWFRKHGVKLPIVMAGYGEDALKVKTADNVDEAKNRRVDYVIGPVGAQPPFAIKASWSELK